MTDLRRLFAGLVLLAAVIVLGGCNTMEGFGRDMEAAGEAISEKADGKQSDSEP